MRDPALRQLLVGEMLKDFNEQSDDKKEKLRELLPRMEQGAYDEEVRNIAVFNEVVVGGGIHASVYQNAMLRTGRDIKSIVVEASKVISSNFRTKEFVSINTKNQPHKPGEMPHQQLQRGNLNYFGSHAPIQVPYIEPELFPTGETIADVATANMYLSLCDILMGEKVKKVIRPSEDPKSKDWPARYKIIFEDGLYIFADRVVIGTGIGRAALPKQFDAETLRTVKEAVEQAPEGVPPAIMTYEQFAQFVTESPTPLRYFAGKTVDLGGGGDSAATIAEVLTRVAKRKVYKLDVGQIGGPKTINWVGQKIKDSNEYRRLLQNERYLTLTSRMPRPEGEKEVEIQQELNPINGKLIQIRPTDAPEKGRFRVTYLMEEGRIQEGYTDFVIMATGYENRVGEVLGFGGNPFDDESLAEAVKGEFPQVEAKLPIAAKLKNEEIYAMGPSAVSQVLLKADLELAGITGQRKFMITRESVSIPTFAPRTEKLAQILGQIPVRQLPHIEIKNEPTTLYPTGSQENSSFILKRTAKESLPKDMLDDVRIKSIIGKLFEGCLLRTEGEATLSLEVTKNDKNSVAITIRPPIKKSQLLEKIFLKEKELGDILTASVLGTRWKIIIDIPFTQKGRVKIPSINLRRELAS